MSLAYNCRCYIYDQSGGTTAKKTWNVFKNKKGRLTDPELVTSLEATDTAVADMVKNRNIKYN